MAEKKALGVIFLFYAFLLFFLMLVAISFNAQNVLTTFQKSPVHIQPDFSQFSDTQEKKQAFFNYFAPIINNQNKIIIKQRSTLAIIKRYISRRGKLSRKLHSEFYSLRTQYNIKADFSTDEALDELDKRVNILPSALVLVQAANESAWGTSRFAMKANNFFGQWCFTEGCGLIPTGRQEGSHHEVKKFASATASVASYFRNINTHAAYKGLREMRYELTQNNETITGSKLAEGLVHYSQRKQHYVHELQSMIKTNNLEQNRKND